MYRARFSIALSSFGRMQFPQSTWNPECRHVVSIAIISREIFPPGDQHAKDLMPQNGFPLFQLQRRGYPEHPFCVEATVRDKNTAMRVETEHIAEGLDGDHRAGYGILFRNDLRTRVW